MAVAKTRVERDQMGGLFRSVHCKFGETRLCSPLLCTCEKHAPNACALVFGMNGELVYGCNTRSRKVFAIILRICGLRDYCSDQRRSGRDNEAIAASNSLAGDFGCLVYGSVVQPHFAKSCISPMQQAREFIN